MPIYKVVGFDSYDQIVAEYRKYISDDIDSVNFPMKNSFRESDSGLLVARYDGGSIFFDPESIKLEKEENGKYYYDSGIQGEVLGEPVSPWMEIQETEDGIEWMAYRLVKAEKP